MDSSQEIPTDDAAVLQALEFVKTLLIPGEALEAYAVQRRLFALAKRRSMVFATSGRFIGMNRGLFGGYSPFDVRWQDIRDARITIGIIGATLVIEALPGSDLAGAGSVRAWRFEGLDKEGAKAVYRICQAQEQGWREKRRLRELEELRAKSGGMQIGASNIAGDPGVPGDSAARLQRAKEMLDKQLISDSEYETIKARIISSL